MKIISIIIPTLNEEYYLPLLLNDLTNQTFKDFEIIVSDFNSKDGTKRIAKEYGCKYIVGGMPAKGRNCGAKVSNSKILLFLDADVRLPSNAIENAINEFTSRNLDIASCNIRLDGKNILNKLAWEIVNILLWTEQFFKKARSHGAFVLVKKTVFEKVNGFDERVIYAEDADFVQRCVKSGAKFRMLRSVFVSTSDRRFRKDGSMRMFLRNIILLFQRNFFGSIKREVVKYEFGHYGDIDAKNKK